MLFNVSQLVRQPARAPAPHAMYATGLSRLIPPQPLRSDRGGEQNPHTLSEGDLILTGTPAGVGPVRSGDRIEVRPVPLPMQAL